MEALHAFAMAAVVLFLKMFMVAFVQGYYRMSQGVFTKPEDAEKFGDGKVQDSELPIVDRGQRTLRNDVENIPIFLFLAGTYVALEAWVTGALIYFSIFVVSRIVHTAAYLRPTQPLRNRAYLLGILSCLIISGHIVYEVVSAAF